MAITDKLFQKTLSKIKLSQKAKHSNIDGKNHLHVYQEIPISTNSNKNSCPKRVRIKGTQKGTDKGYKNNKRVQEKGTIKGTQKGTIKGTDKGYKNTDKIPVETNIDYENLTYKRTYKTLSGIPQKIVNIIFELSQRYGKKETPPIAFQALVNFCNAKKNSVKVARKRLLHDKLISTKMPQNYPTRGKANALIYFLSNDLFAEMNNEVFSLMNNGNLNENTNVIKGTQKGTIKGTSLPSSSSILINTTTTRNKTMLPHDWNIIDTSAIKNFGKTALKNIYLKSPENITAKIVQDSIYQYAYGLKNNPHRYKNIRSNVGLLVNELIEGRPWIEDGYISPAEMKRRAVEKKLEEKMEKVKDSQFQAFFDNLSEEKKDALVPEDIKNDYHYNIAKIRYQEDAAKAYFNEVIWAEELLDIKKTMGILVNEENRENSNN